MVEIVTFEFLRMTMFQIVKLEKHTVWAIGHKRKDVKQKKDSCFFGLGEFWEFFYF